MSLSLTITDNADGSGGVATIAGADSATTATVYYQTLSVLEGASRWTVAGSRSGNGTLAVTATGTGSYFWYAAGTVSAAPAISNVLPQSLTNANAVSVHYQCMVAYQQIIQGLKLFDAIGGSVDPKERVSLGWTPADVLGMQNKPGVAICPAGQEGQPGMTANTDDIEYPIAVILYDLYAGPTGNLDRNLLWRERIFRALRHARVSGVPTTITAPVQPREIIVEVLSDKSKLWYSALLFRPISREKRGAA